MVNLRSTFTGLQSSPHILSVSNDISVARRSLHWLNWNRGGQGAGYHCRVAGFRIAFRILCQVSKSETKLYDLFTS